MSVKQCYGHRSCGLQVVGLRGGYHTAMVMGGVNSKIHAKRLAQASEILIELRANGGRSRTGCTLLHCLCQ